MPMLEWAGKKKVVNHHNEVPFHTLVRKWGFGENSHTEAQRHGGGEAERVDGAADGGLPQKLRDSVSPCDENMIIHGDNLLALKSLLPRYEGKVKCIYIDPPYNTGEESWEYNDNVKDPQMEKWIGKVVGKEDEDLTRHDKWLCMMYPRLMLLHKLLSTEGTIFISIDDNELYSLKLLMDEIFGRSNFVCNFIWEKRVNRENRKVVSSRHDYILCYAKSVMSQLRVLKQLPMTGEALDRYQNPDNDPRGPWKSDPTTAQAGHATAAQFYTLTVPCGKTFDPPPGSCWRFTEPVMLQMIKEGRIWLGAKGTNMPRKKTYLYEKDRGLTPETLWFARDVSTNEKAKNELKEIFPEAIPFTTPKPHELVEQILRIASDKDSIILDSFAGSGTTAHAVLNANKQDGGNRKFILVEMMDYAESVTAERVKRVIRGYGHTEARRHGGGSASQDLRDSVAPCETTNATGGSFGYYELGPELMRDGVLNEEAGAEAIREYVWYTETRGAGKFSHTEAQRHGEGEAGRVFGAADGRASQKLRDSVAPCEEYLLGTAFGVAYYFCYEKGEVVTLNRALLKKIKTKAESYVVYADICTLSAAELEKYHITFKKIPRDITRF